MILKKLSLYLFWIFAFFAYQLTKLVVILERKKFFKMKFPKNIKELQDQKDWCIAKLIQSKVLSEESSILSYSVKQLNAEAIYRSDTGLVTIEFQGSHGIETFQCIAKFSPSAGSVDNRAVFNLQENHIKEVNFYKFLASKLNGKANVPEIYYATYDALTANSILLLEYLPSAPSYQSLEACPDEKLVEIVQEFAFFHAAYWKQEAKVPGIKPIPKIIADFFASSCNSWWSDNMNLVFHKNWEYMNVNQTLIHGDARIGNMIINKDEKVFLIDWQAARLSIASYDLAYFLILSLTVDQRKEQEEKLKQAYYESLKANIQEDYSKQAFEIDYNQACLMVLTMLAIPWLSGEGSFDADSETLVNFTIGHYFWHKRLENKMKDFDFTWMSKEYDIGEEQCQEVVQAFVKAYYQEMDKLAQSSIEIKNKFDLRLAEIKQE